MEKRKALIQTMAPESFRALPDRIAVRDVRDLMTYPFFSLSKSKRTEPIDFHTGEIAVRVEGTAEHGIASIWDADVLIWAASQLVEARDLGLATSNRIVTTACEILQFIGRGTSARDYARLRAALNRLKSTIVTIIRRGSPPQRFSWISEWKEGMELVLSDWLYACVVEQCAVLTINRAYFTLSGGIEGWLWRVVRRHAGKQPGGWRFDFHQLYVKSGSRSAFKDFSCDLRRIAGDQVLPGYQLAVERHRDGGEMLRFAPAPRKAIAPVVRALTRSMSIVDKL